MSSSLHLAKVEKCKHQPVGLFSELEPKEKKMLNRKLSVRTLSEVASAVILSHLKHTIPVYPSLPLQNGRTWTIERIVFIRLWIKWKNIFKKPSSCLRSILLHSLNISRLLNVLQHELLCPYYPHHYSRGRPPNCTALPSLHSCCWPLTTAAELVTKQQTGCMGDAKGESARPISTHNRNPCGEVGISL